MIYITRENSSFLKLESDDESIIKTIKDAYMFDTPNFQFTKRYKLSNKKWNGKINLLKKNKYLYSGLRDNLKTFLNKLNYPYKDQCIDNIKNTSISDIEDFIDILQLPFEPKDYQIKSVHAFINKQNMILVSPTASGKTLILYIIICLLIKLKLVNKILIIVPTISLVDQCYKNFLEYSQYSNKLNSFFQKQIHRVYSGEEKETNKLITFGTYQSMVLCSNEYISNFDFIGADECHLMSKSSGQFIFESGINTKFRFGMTGTLHETELDVLVLEGLIGQPIQFVKTMELMNRGDIANFQVNNVLLQYSDDVKLKLFNKTYQDEYNEIISNKNRLEYINNFVLNLNKNVLLLYTRIDKHGKLIYDSLNEMNIDKSIHFLSGRNETEDREFVIDLAEKENNLVMVCSYGIFSTGISIKNIHHIIFASPYKSKFKVLQSIGRGLRLNKNKEICNIYDFIDDFRYNGKNNYLFEHFKNRYKLYKYEGFNLNNIVSDTILRK